MKESRYNVWVSLGGFEHLYNGVSGELVRLTAEQRNGLSTFLAGSDSGGQSVDFSMLERLVRNRMLIHDETDEIDFLRKRYALSRHSSTKLGLTIVTSLGCNFDCPYCFEAKKPQLLHADVEQHLLTFLDKRLDNLKQLDVTWFGGEPLMGKGSLLRLSKELISRCDHHGVQYGAAIITNGYLLSLKTCEELAAHRVTTAQVTLDGPPEVHNAMRPLASGRGSFSRIIRNLHWAVEILQSVVLRVNVDASNVEASRKLLTILADQGLADKVAIYPGHIVAVDSGSGAPSETYGACCFTTSQFARVEQDFYAAAESLGFRRGKSPGPTGAPCTAVKANDLVVGSGGELYKCWDSVGNSADVIGHINEMSDADNRLTKWVGYDPFSNQECRECRALPSCMGGCAHYAMNPSTYENRCGTFRFTQLEQVTHMIRSSTFDPQGRRIVAQRRSIPLMSTR